MGDNEAERRDSTGAEAGGGADWFSCGGGPAGVIERGGGLDAAGGPDTGSGVMRTGAETGILANGSVIESGDESRSTKGGGTPSKVWMCLPRPTTGTGVGAGARKGAGAASGFVVVSSSRSTAL